MAKHANRPTGADSSGPVVVIRPVVLSAEAYLDRAKTAAPATEPPGRHARG